ncbi:MAG: SprT-like domain-containing protein [Nanoarchaeota archaeon]
MNLIEESFREIFPDRPFTFQARIRYSRAFKDYNANIKHYKQKDELIISLSKKWNAVSKDIKKGLIQELLWKLFGKGKHPQTLSMDLYHIYLRNTHLSAEKDNIDPELQKSFERVNERYFNGMIDQTNLVWGTQSTRTLGRYEYGSDTIMISRIFEDAPERLIDRVMHHEMLHKKHKYSTKNGRSHHHTPAFRREERMFEDFEIIEKEIQRLIAGFPRRTRRPTTIRKLFRW